MKIGVKYCGGCNPSFDRKKAVERVLGDFNNFNIETANDIEAYDILLVVNGCSRSCADYEVLKTHKILFLNSLDDYDKINEAFHTMIFEV